MDDDLANKPGVPRHTSLKLNPDLGNVPNIRPLDRIYLRGSRGGACPQGLKRDGWGAQSFPSTQHQLQEGGGAGSRRCSTHNMNSIRNSYRWRGRGGGRGECLITCVTS